MALSQISPERLLKGYRSIHILRNAVGFCARGPFSNRDQKLGEDAYIIRTWITPGVYQGASLVGVADGVGGWKRHGVDPSHLSQGLLEEMDNLFQAKERQPDIKESTNDTEKFLDCHKLLTSAFTKLYETGPKYAGGTTVCVGQFNPQSASIQILNLGDSGAWLARNNNILEKTKPDVQGMMPQQLTILPEWMNEADVQNDSLDPEAQTSHNNIYTWQLQHDDLVIFGTDGFFDNVSERETLAIIEQVDGEKSHRAFRARSIADRLLALAYSNSLNPHIASPFALRCLQEDDFDFWGGKPDDITILVCDVVESELHFPKI